MKTIQLGGRTCHYTEKTAGPLPVVFCGVSGEYGNYESEEDLPEFEGLAANFFFFETKDWDGDFSPWPAEMQLAPGAARIFAGKGEDTLKWLLDDAIPRAEEVFGAQRRIIAGYSLSGLFAMWAFYESGAFDGVVSASASFWYEGWENYMAKARIPAEMARRTRYAYLSLGGKEPKTKNPIMATIGEAYERQKRRMKEDPQIAAVLFEWNPGGHFANDKARIAKGIRWLLQQDWCKIEET